MDVGIGRDTAVKRYMKRKGVTIVDLAGRLDLDRTYLSTIVNGWATPTTLRRWAPRIAEALNAEVHVLFPDLEALKSGQTLEEALGELAPGQDPATIHEEEPR